MSAVLERRTLLSDGLERTYLLHIPSGARGPLPLIIALHGSGGDAALMARMTEFHAHADGFAVCYPGATGNAQGRLRAWNSGDPGTYAHKNRVDDVAFIRAMIEQINSEHPLDRLQLCVAGFSNGGMMAYRLACDLSGTFRAIAVVSGAHNYKEKTPTHPLSVLIFHGVKDRHVLYHGGPSPKSLAKRTDQPVSHAVQFWARHNACRMEPLRETHGPVIKETYPGGTNQTEVVCYTLENQGHAWPGGQPGAENGNLDAPSQEISATRLTVNFFKTHFSH